MSRAHTINDQDKESYLAICIVIDLFLIFMIKKNDCKQICYDFLLNNICVGSALASEIRAPT